MNLLLIMNARCRWLMLLLLPGFLSVAGVRSPAAATKPNFVVLLCDDLGYGDLSCFAHPTIKTPSLDKLAAEGLRLTNCYSLYWQYDFAISQPWEVSMRDGPWKLLANKTLDQFELYNVVDDVGETKNLAGRQAERVKKMAAAMKKLHAEINSEGARSGNPPPRLGQQQKK